MNTAASPVAAPTPSQHILVVDDTATNRQILGVFLKKLGHQVDLAEDGAQAVELFAAKAYDLVIMDVMMPVMDGYEATRRIKAMCGNRWVPVIFLSALDKDESLVTGLEAGGDDYLPKPVNFVVLAAKLRSLSRALVAAPRTGRCTALQPGRHRQSRRCHRHHQRPRRDRIGESGRLSDFRLSGERNGWP